MKHPSHLSIHSSIHPSIHPPIHPCIHPFRILTHRPPPQALQRACEGRQIETLMVLIEHGATVDTPAPGKEFRGQTAPHIAAGRGPLGLVSTLIGCGADPSRGAADGTLPVEAVSSWSTRDAEQARGLCVLRTRTVHMHCARGVFLDARLVCTAQCAAQCAAHAHAHAHEHAHAHAHAHEHAHAHAHAHARARGAYVCRCAACCSRRCGSVRSAPVGSSS